MNIRFSQNALKLRFDQRALGAFLVLGAFMVVSASAQTNRTGPKAPPVLGLGTNANLEPVWITAPAVSTQRDGQHYLTITNAQHRYEFNWDALPVSLVPGRVYSFMVVVENSNSAPTPKLVRVEGNGTLVPLKGVCEVHKIPIEWKEVPILYGLYVPGDKENQLFPHRQEVIRGGCGFGLPERGRQAVCPACEAAYERWKEWAILELLSHH
jgi:hypothetical protein